MEQRLIAVGILPDYARAAAELFDDEGEVGLRVSWPRNADCASYASPVACFPGNQ